MQIDANSGVNLQDPSVIELKRIISRRIAKLESDLTSANGNPLEAGLQLTE